MERVECPITPCVRTLRAAAIPFTPFLYEYREHGGTHVAAESLGVPEHRIIKTLVLDADGAPLILLMHGDREASLKRLGRILHAKHVEMCGQAEALRITGYLFGGTSPFATRRPLPVYVESTIFELPTILINGGKRGFLVELDPKALRILDVKEVETSAGAETS